MPVRFRRQYAAIALLALAALALAGCAGDGREEREPANAWLLGGLMTGAMADCSRRLEAGEFATHVERARCEGEEARGSVEGLGMEYAFGDLVALLSEWRLRLARERDAGTLDTAGERARHEEFGTAFVREMDIRERLHNNGVPSIGFNFCEIEGNGLRCTRVDTERLENEYYEAEASCDLKSRNGIIDSDVTYTRCLFEEGMVPVYDRNSFPHMELVRLISAYMVQLSKRWADRKITTDEFRNLSRNLLGQYLEEIERRDTVRATGNLNWRQRTCQVHNDQLNCR